MDFDKIEQLLNVAEKAFKWPNLKHIHDAAMTELEATKEKPEPIVIRKIEEPK